MFSRSLARHLGYLSGTTHRAYNSALPRPQGRVIFSGIQPTGIPHLGNILGALSNWVKIQNEAPAEDVLIFSIVGWHALTLPQDPSALLASRRDMLAALLAVGVNIKRSILFYQDHNPSHTELAWLLNCITPVGKLRRMTTWKARLAASRNASDESEVDESLLNTGLFTYPVLQAADILLYRSTHVPVGDDQTQHLELCRDLAETFNRTFAPSSPAFPLPVRMSTPSGRILSLRDPTSKMSKSSPDIASRILLTDTDAQIKSKIRSAVTDSIAGITYDPVERPGTSNLLTILAACTDENVHSVAERYEGKRHSELKADVADAVVEKLRGPRDEFQMARRQSSFLDNIAYSGAIKAKERSDVTMQAVRKMVGLPDIDLESIRFPQDD